MFKISPIQNIEEQILCAKKCNTEYKKGAFAYAMNDADTGELMGFSQFEINGNGGFLHDLRPADGYDDYEAMFILGRATMNFIDLCGVKIAFFDGKCTDDALLRRIGFSTDEKGRYTLSLDGFFTHACQHHPQ